MFALQQRACYTPCIAWPWHKRSSVDLLENKNALKSDFLIHASEFHNNTCCFVPTIHADCILKDSYLDWGLLPDPVRCRLLCIQNDIVAAKLCNQLIIEYIIIIDNLKLTSKSAALLALLQANCYCYSTTIGKAFSQASPYHVKSDFKKSERARTF